MLQCRSLQSHCFNHSSWFLIYSGPEYPKSYGPNWPPLSYMCQDEWLQITSDTLLLALSKKGCRLQWKKHPPHQASQGVKPTNHGDWEDAIMLKKKAIQKVHSTDNKMFSTLSPTSSTQTPSLSAISSTWWLISSLKQGRSGTTSLPWLTRSTPTSHKKIFTIYILVV